MQVSCRTKNVNKYYKVIGEVGSGTYGKVYKAKCLKTNDFVALKKIDTKDQKIMAEGFPITAIREIKLLKIMNHKNILRLREIIISKASFRNNFRGSTFLVFDYYDHDFAGLHRLRNIFTLPQIKCIFKQLLEGVKYLHESKIIHRDLKCANILMNNKGQVTLADFGLARTLSNVNNPKYTYKVVTLWYRAPELLLGQTNYNTQIDMWSLGCIFAELITGEVLFKGDIEFRQMERIYELCGSATEQNWSNCVNLRQWEEFKPRRNYERLLVKHIKDVCQALNKQIDQVTLDLIDHLLILDPNKRLNAIQALNHDFFKQEPKACQPNEMPQFEKEFHETLLKNEMRLQQQRLEKQQMRPSSNTTQKLQKVVRDERNMSKPQQSSPSRDQRNKQEIDFEDIIKFELAEEKKKVKLN
ncbi:unnamed protein product [Paramecium pentaurelia]|uniref:Cyclin-dependent kinase 2 homolog n=1 Tax=Paramecium pentaurelia TaxID=43138 RepID=A0A8S1WH57_9CILI|nr:unnamed protein product [Paramecium pentaurelia]